ncbi:MAG: hypothetical protein AAF558_00245 [Verrucomicrobiota bacterium]
MRFIAIAFIIFLVLVAIIIVMKPSEVQEMPVAQTLSVGSESKKSLPKGIESSDPQAPPPPNQSTIRKEPTPPRNEIPQTILLTERDQGAIFTAILEYLEVFRKVPEGSNAEITQALATLQKSRPALQGEELRIHASGQLVDPWGNAYRFTRKSEHSIKIDSAGPDRQFDTDDDITAENFDNRIDL